MLCELWPCLGTVTGRQWWCCEADSWVSTTPTRPHPLHPHPPVRPFVPLAVDELDSGFPSTLWHHRPADRKHKGPGIKDVFYLCRVTEWSESAALVICYKSSSHGLHYKTHNCRIIWVFLEMARDALLLKVWSVQSEKEWWEYRSVVDHLGRHTVLQSNKLWSVSEVVTDLADCWGLHLQLSPSHQSAMFVYSDLMFGLKRFCKIFHLTSDCWWVKSFCVCCVVPAVLLDTTHYTTKYLSFLPWVRCLIMETKIFKTRYLCRDHEVSITVFSR